MQGEKKVTGDNNIYIYMYRYARMKHSPPYSWRGKKLLEESDVVMGLLSQFPGRLEGGGGG